MSTNNSAGKLSADKKSETEYGPEKDSLNSSCRGFPNMQDFARSSIIYNIKITGEVFLNSYFLTLGRKSPVLRGQKAGWITELVWTWGGLSERRLG